LRPLDIDKASATDDIKDMIVQEPQMYRGQKLNQTPEHQDLSKRCLVWLSNKATGRGIRGCNELMLGEKYIADAVAIASLQSRLYTEFLNLKPIYKSGMNELLELDEADLESRPPNEFVFVFEAKATRSDFLSTFGPTNYEVGNRRYAAGHLHYIVARRGVCQVEEVPDFWGLLMASGVGLRVLKSPSYAFCSEEKLNRIAYSILWKRQSSLRDITHCPDCMKEIK
jgi:hypothetical protein